VVAAENGKRGLELLKKANDIRVLIVDLLMLEVSGIDVLKELKNYPYPLRRIVLTAHDEELPFEDAEELKVFVFLNKPVRKHSLIFAVRSAFNDLYREELERELEIVNNKCKKLGKDTEDYVHLVGIKAASIPDSLTFIQKGLGEISTSMNSEFSNIKKIVNQLIDLKHKTVMEPCESERPCIFIGSSKESIDVAKALELNLHEKFEISIWDKSFQFSTAVIESLYRALKENDFAIFVMNADDLTTSREVTQKSPRDNIIFEIGLFMGYLGRSRVFIVCEESDDDLKVPSDLAGVLIATFNRDRCKNKSLSNVVRPVCTKISEEIEKYRDFFQKNNKSKK
jgi:predicted nucleotide-binding protein